MLRHKVLEPTGSKLRKFFLGAVFTERRCYRKYFEFATNEHDDFRFEFDKSYLYIEHQCGGKTAIQKIYLPAFKTNDYMNRQLKLSLGYIDLSRQLVKNLNNLL